MRVLWISTQRNHVHLKFCMPVRMPVLLVPFHSTHLMPSVGHKAHIVRVPHIPALSWIRHPPESKGNKRKGERKIICASNL